MADVPDAVIDLAARRLERNPHREGAARCLACKHEWHAIVPASVWILECPVCELERGVFKGLPVTEGHEQWRCNCGELLFFLDDRGAYCANCGVRPPRYNSA